MINLDDLTIGQARKLAAQFTPTATAQPNGFIDHGLQIAVLDRGFVYIGHVTTDGEWCHITDAWNIRRWGTTRGLSELVNGPTNDTRLDRVGHVRVPFHSLQHLITVEVAAWNGKLD